MCKVYNVIVSVCNMKSTFFCKWCGDPFRVPMQPFWSPFFLLLMFTNHLNHVRKDAFSQNQDYI